MKKIFNYIKSEWRYWLASLLVVIGISAQPHVEATPIHSYKAGDFRIYDDSGANTWYIKYDKVVKDLKQPYDDIKVIWHGEHKGRPIVFMSGQQGRMCEMGFRLFFVDEEGHILEDSDFDTCYAEQISVKLIDDYLIIRLDGDVRNIRLW